MIATEQTTPHFFTELTIQEQQNRGAVLGGAIGDAMGAVTEFMSLESIRSQFGAEGVQGYVRFDSAGRARYTDDTQMAEVVLRCLIISRQGNLDLDETMRLIAAGFVEWSRNPQGGHRAPGGACMSGCRALANGTRWDLAGGQNAGGCGSVMRAYPFGLVFSDDPEKAAAWAAKHSMLTHRHPIAIAASAAMAMGIAMLKNQFPLPAAIGSMIITAGIYDPLTAKMMAWAYDQAHSLSYQSTNGRISRDAVYDRLRGFSAHEAIAAAVFCVARNAFSPSSAILDGANTPGDSDSIATLAGSLMGACFGESHFTPEWVSKLERSEELTALAMSIPMTTASPFTLPAKGHILHSLTGRSAAATPVVDDENRRLRMYPPRKLGDPIFNPECSWDKAGALERVKPEVKVVAPDPLNPPFRNVGEAPVWGDRFFHLKPGTLVWYETPNKRWPAVVAELPRQLGEEFVVRLKDLPKKYAKKHGGRTTLAAAACSHITMREVTRA